MGSHTTLQHEHMWIVLSGRDEVSSHPWGLLHREDAGPRHTPLVPHPTRLPQRHSSPTSHHITHISRPSAPLPASDGNQGNEKEAAKVKHSPGPPERGPAGG